MRVPKSLWSRSAIVTVVLIVAFVGTMMFAGRTGQRAPDRADHKSLSGKALAGMLWIPAGRFSMGSSFVSFPDAQPIHLVKVDGFWMDATAVTNAQFEAFVTATGY